MAVFAIAPIPARAESNFVDRSGALRAAQKFGYFARGEKSGPGIHLSSRKVQDLSAESGGSGQNAQKSPKFGGSGGVPKMHPLNPGLTAENFVHSPRGLLHFSLSAAERICLLSGRLLLNSAGNAENFPLSRT